MLGGPRAAGALGRPQASGVAETHSGSPWWKGLQWQGLPPLAGSPKRHPIPSSHPLALAGLLPGEGVGRTPPPPPGQAPSCPWPISLTSLPACQGTAVLPGGKLWAAARAAGSALGLGSVIGVWTTLALVLWTRGASGLVLGSGVPGALSSQCY